MDKVVEEEHHILLESGSNIFKSKWHNAVCKRPPRGCERSLVLVLFLDSNLVITRKTIHERKDFVASTSINDLVNERNGDFVFGTCQIEVVKFNTYTNGTLIYIHYGWVGNPGCVSNGKDESYM